MPGLNGLVVMTPTSVTPTGAGSSASIGTNGRVTYSACATLSINGVFTNTYQNYLIVASNKSGNFNAWTGIRLRSSGTDNSTTASYVYQNLNTMTTTSPAGIRGTNNYAQIGHSSPTAAGGFSMYLFGPNLAQPTAGRADFVSGYTNALYFSGSFTHNQSVSYDGFTLYGLSVILTGSLTVFGFNQ